MSFSWINPKCPPFPLWTVSVPAHTTLTRHTRVTLTNASYHKNCSTTRALYLITRGSLFNSWEMFFFLSHFYVCSFTAFTFTPVFLVLEGFCSEMFWFPWMKFEYITRHCWEAQLMMLCKLYFTLKFVNACNMQYLISG